jgi:hypothetical protein
MLRLAERNRQLQVNSRAAQASALTEGEIAAVLANAAYIDHRNLIELRSAPDTKRPAPRGATDLTNEVNEPLQTVTLHPALTLFNGLNYALEQRNAPAALCMEGKEVAELVEEKYLTQLKHAGLSPAWPAFRRDWENALSAKGYIDWKTYGPRRPRPGCSPEFILDCIASDNHLIPKFEKLDRLMIRGQLLAEGVRDSHLELEVEKRYASARAEVDSQLSRWSIFAGEARETFAAAVEKPLCDRSKAWFYACKELSPEETQRIGKFFQEVSAFAKTQPELDRVVLEHAASTATISVNGPTMDDRIVKTGLGLGERAIMKGVKAGVDKGADALGEYGVELAERALDAGASATGPLALLYFVGKFAAKVLAPKIAEKAGEKVELGIGKVVGWAKTTTQNLAYEESRANETELSAKVSFEQHANNDIATGKLLRLMTPAGLRAAALLNETFAAAHDSGRIEKVISFVSSFDTPSSSAGAAADLAKSVNPKAPAALYEDPARLDFEFTGTRQEQVQASKMASAAVIESALGIVASTGRQDWVKGSARLSNSLANAQEEFRRIMEVDQITVSGTEDAAQRLEQRVDDECYDLLARATEAHLEPMGDGMLFSGRSLSRLLSCSESAYEKETGKTVPRRSETDDLAVLKHVNTGLWTNQLHPDELRQQISDIAPFELVQPVSESPSLEEDLKMAEVNIAKTVAAPRVE